MEKIRLMDQPKDYKNLGIDQKYVSPKEDGRRDTSKANHNEVWYFDGIFNDGSKVVIGFRPRDPYAMGKDGDRPNLNLLITKPNGETIQDFIYADNSINTMSKDGLDIHFGENSASGDWKNFTVKAYSNKHISCNLNYHSIVEPFRQGTGIITLGNQEENYYTDLSVPNCNITGTLTYDGKEHAVQGQGYHDHQWMNITPYLAWHHWLWGHMYTKDYTVYIYDFVSSKKYGFKRIPMFGIFDNKTGQLIFKTNGKVVVTTEKEPQSNTDRLFPKASHYTFDNEINQVKVDIAWIDEIEVRDMYSQTTDAGRKQFDSMELKPEYVRYYAKGSISLINGNNITTQSGNLIYEYNYIGKPTVEVDV